MTKKHQMLSHALLVEPWWVRWPLEQTYYQNADEKSCKIYLTTLPRVDRLNDEYRQHTGWKGPKKRKSGHT